MKKIKLRSGEVCMVDDCNFKKLKSIKWLLQKGGNCQYAVASHGGLMHRLIMNVTDSKVHIDHKDGNGLNNQKSNLRLVTHAQNMCNRRSSTKSKSKYLGVSWSKPHKKWVASIKKKGVPKRELYIGKFTTEVDAARAYNKAALKFHGEFANFNDVGIPTDEEYAELISRNNIGTRDRYKRVEFRGENILLKEYCKNNNLPFSNINQRIRQNWSVERALTTPVRSHKKHRC